MTPGQLPAPATPARRASLLFGTMLTCALAGCGSELGAEASGVVTFNGKPVGPGMVAFVPVDGSSNPADGAIQIDGTFFLKTNRVVGLEPGKYRASVTVLDQPEVKPGERSYEAPRQVTPQKYADPATSGLEFDVKPGSNTIDLPLVSD
jgi:hypothetical protein